MKCKGWILGVTPCGNTTVKGQRLCAGCRADARRNVERRQRTTYPGRHAGSRHGTTAYRGHAYEPSEHALPLKPPGKED